MCGCVCFQADLISNPAKTTLHWPSTTMAPYSLDWQGERVRCLLSVYFSFKREGRDYF